MVQAKNLKHIFLTLVLCFFSCPSFAQFKLLDPVDFGLPASAREVFSQRTMRQAVFYMGHKQFAAVSASGMFTHDAFGHVILAQVKGRRQGHAFVFDRLADDVKIRFDLDRPSFTMSREGYSYTFAFNARARARAVVEDDHTLVYRLNGRVTLQWQVQGNKVHKKIVVEKPGPLPDLSFRVIGCGLRPKMGLEGIDFVTPVGDTAFRIENFSILNKEGVKQPVPVVFKQKEGRFFIDYDARFLTFPYVLDPSSGPLGAGTGADDGSGASVWSNPGNITADDASYAVNTPGQSPSDYLEATNFGFSIPVGSTINGIYVEIEVKASQDLPFSHSVGDNSVRLIQGGAIGGTDESTYPHWPTAEGYNIYGSSSDLWGLSWTVAQINASNFGVALNVITVNFGADAYVNYVRITVYYSPSASNAPFFGTEF